MNKKEVVWLVVRLIGVYLLYLAAITSISLIGTLLTALQTPELASRSMSMFVSPALLAVMEGIVGFYLVNTGTVLFNILAREEPRID
ncbi:MAG TPA: hypothetical protein VGO50_07910 [Pyrinomonadaceae bacterium]|jgi:hypothetical protein|nr:hypothetical protein [Pyrinomonadaceae bacterium]